MIQDKFICVTQLNYTSKATLSLLKAQNLLQLF